MHVRSLHGNREISRLTSRRLWAGPHREGEEPKPMMHGSREVRPLHSSDEVGEQRLGNRLRSRWSEGRGPRGTRERNARAGHRAGKACSRGWTVYGKQQRQGRRSGSPLCFTMLTVELLEGSIFLAQAECGAGGRRSDMEGLRAEPGSQPRRLACPRSSGRLSGASITAEVHRETGWAATSTRHRGAGRQNRPAGRGGGAQCNLRRRLSGVLVRVPTRAQPA